MPIRIGDGFMRLEIDGRVVATATERAGGWWEVTYWPRFFDRNQAITALTITELLDSGRDRGDPERRADQRRRNDEREGRPDAGGIGVLGLGQARKARRRRAARTPRGPS